MPSGRKLRIEQYQGEKTSRPIKIYEMINENEVKVENTKKVLREINQEMGFNITLFPDHRQRGLNTQELGRQILERL